jgi:hypothetical protein
MGDVCPGRFCGAEAEIYGANAGHLPGEGGRGNGGDLQIINAHVASNPSAHNMTGLLATLSALGTPVRINPKPLLLRSTILFFRLVS